MSAAAEIVTLGLELARVGLDAAQGRPDPKAIGKAAVDVALAFVPIEELRGYLDAAAIARAELAADAIEDARFPR